MEIGKPEPAIVVEPAEHPFEIDVPETPAELPAPVKTPAKEPVPAGSQHGW